MSDRPIGWANSHNSPKNYGGYSPNNSGKIYDNVDSYEKLKQALSEEVERRIIFITNAIDLNAGKTPYDYIVNCGYGDKYSSYEDYKQKFAQTCVKDSKSELHDVQQNLFNAQKRQVRINIPSNTTIIGKNSQAAILNGEINITNKENVVIRNLKIWNAEDYFPLWYQSKENNFNSVYDNITIDNSKWIWIDENKGCDTYGEFFATFECKEKSAKIRISVDSNYTLFLNGKFVSSGQYPDFPYFKVLNLP